MSHHQAVRENALRRQCARALQHLGDVRALGPEPPDTRATENLTLAEYVVSCNLPELDDRREAYTFIVPGVVETHAQYAMSCLIYRCKAAFLRARAYDDAACCRGAYAVRKFRARSKMKSTSTSILNAFNHGAVMKTKQLRAAPTEYTNLSWRHADL